MENSEFWKQVYLAAFGNGGGHKWSVAEADGALEAFRQRFGGSSKQKPDDQSQASKRIEAWAKEATND